MQGLLITFISLVTYNFDSLLLFRKLLMIKLQYICPIMESFTDLSTFSYACFFTVLGVVKDVLYTKKE